ncbi:MAG: SIS domain-containing protein [Elusimicrobia bacterium]|nr:SIS domain-containing protein [Elusimicrobiota bacterium]
MPLSKNKAAFAEICRSFSGLLGEIEITDGRGRSLGEQGFQAAVELIRRQSGLGRKICIVGNGGSAAIASHQATDYFKMCGLRATAFNNSSLLTCLANDYSYEEVFSRQIERMADPGDVLIVISSSGKSPNILKAASAGSKTGCRIITLSGFAPANPLRAKGEINFYVPSDDYGQVECAHGFICHAFITAINANKQP